MAEEDDVAEALLERSSRCRGPGCSVVVPSAFTTYRGGHGRLEWCTCGWVSVGYDKDARWVDSAVCCSRACADAWRSDHDHLVVRYSVFNNNVAAPTVPA